MRSEIFSGLLVSFEIEMNLPYKIVLNVILIDLIQPGVVFILRLSPPYFTYCKMIAC